MSVIESYLSDLSRYSQLHAQITIEQLIRLLSFGCRPVVLFKVM